MRRTKRIILGTSFSSLSTSEHVSNVFLLNCVFHHHQYNFHKYHHMSITVSQAFSMNRLGFCQCLIWSVGQKYLTEQQTNIMNGLPIITITITIMGYHCPHQLWNHFQAPPPLPLLQTSFDHLTSSENSALTAVYHRMKTNSLRRGNMMRFYEAHHLSQIRFLSDSIFFPRLLFCLVSGTSYNDHNRCEMI